MNFITGGAEGGLRKILLTSIYLSRSISRQISSAAHGEPRKRRASTISALSNPNTRCSVSISGLPNWLAMQDLGDRKCIGKSRKSFVGHPSAKFFRPVLRDRVFQHPQAITQACAVCSPFLGDFECNRGCFAKYPRFLCNTD